MTPDSVLSAGRDGPVHVLSIQSNSLGNGSYCTALRRHMADDARVRIESVWTHEEREFLARIAYRLVDYRFPFAQIRGRNYDVRRARNEAATGLLGRRLAVRYARRRQPQVLHFHTQVPALLSTDVMRRIPTVITTDQTSVQATDADATAPDWAHRPSVVLDRRTFRAAAHSVLFSEWARRSVLDDYGLDPARTSVIPPGVDIERFRDSCPPRDATRERPVILHVGNDWARKGGSDLLEVFRDRLADRCELHFVTSWPVPDVAGAVVHRGVEPFSAKWFALYRAADIFVLPTRVEPFGLVFLEAMAAGLPVIGTRISAVPEIVADGDTGILVAPADKTALSRALEPLVHDAERRRQMGEAGRARAARMFDARTNFGRLADVFRAAAAGSPSPTGW